MRSWFRKRLTVAVAALAMAGLMTPVASAGPQAPPENITAALKRIPGLTIVGEDPAPDGFRFFRLTYTQPADHRKPKAGTFEQRLTLLHRDVSAPTVMFTSGYGVSSAPNRSEPTQIVNGNQVSMEYRYFTPSIPDKPNWRKQLTIRQAAIDQHRVVSAFKSIYRANWLATGGSKGGMTATYFRRFFPNDVDGTIPYVAPNDVINKDDSYNELLSKVGTPGCRSALRAVQRDALKRRHELRVLARRASKENGYTYRITGSLDRAMELAITDTYFTFWQYQPPTECRNIPKPGTPAKDVYAWFEKVDSLTTYADQQTVGSVPYHYQAAYQLGWYETYDAHLRGLLRYPGAFVPWTFFPKGLERPRFDRVAMLDIDYWVRTKASQTLYVYGEYDPWGAERFEPNTARSSDNHVYTVPKGNHGAKIAQLPQAQADRATATVRRWAGLPADSGSASRLAGNTAPAGFPLFNADLMTIERPRL